MRRKKGSFRKIVILLVLIVLVGGVAYLYNSEMFERKKPIISLQDSIYWNLKKPIEIKIADESGIKFARVTIEDGENTIVLANNVYKDKKQQEVTINASLPRTAFLDKKSNLVLHVETSDNSMWNFFMGNEAKKSTPIIIDTINPLLHVLINSYSIRKGGVGTVIFKSSDKNLESLYIQTNSGKIYRPTPFYKPGYYISFVAWESDQKDFSATIIAQDKAKNQARNSIRFYLLSKTYKTSKLKLTDNFIDGKITQLVQNYSQKDFSAMSMVERFKYVNEELRQKNETLIGQVTKLTNKQMVSSFYLKPFYPLRNGAAVASFGDHRFYSYNGEQISESYHLGLDLASVAEANIKSTNSGIVVFAKDNGIYGNNLIINHGLGVYSLYGHCSSFNVNEGDIVKTGDIIAKTGVSGLALGDHLHFGILVQGVEVRPEEWMDKKWFKDNITNIIEDAKKMIDRK